jgi:S-adenosylhomocysteine hydrolase
MQNNKSSILDTLVTQALDDSNGLPLAKTAVIYVHHALRSSTRLLRAQFELGLAPQNTFVLNKHYSECKAVVEDIKNLGVYYQPCSTQVGLGKFSNSFIRDINSLWNKVLSNLPAVDNFIIMDHGGYALDFVPSQILETYNIAGIEKTTAGLIGKNIQGLPFPIIETASCAAKKILESTLIAEAVVTKLTPLIPIQNNELTCAVIGYGAIGQSITNKLLSMGHKVIVYDRNQHKLQETKGVITTNKLSVAIAFSDYIFGCTGRDIAKSIDIFELCPQDKTLISCSSEDKEFLSLIQHIQRRRNLKKTINPLDDIVYQNNFGANIHILRGGFPINFDHSGESVPHKDIELTRALVLASVLQSIRIFQNKNLLKQGGTYMLNPKLQKIIVNEWIKTQPHARFQEDIISKFQDENWIAKNSGGNYEAGCD